MKASSLRAERCTSVEGNVTQNRHDLELLSESRGGQSHSNCSLKQSPVSKITQVYSCIAAKITVAACTHVSIRDALRLSLFSCMPIARYRYFAV